MPITITELDITENYLALTILTQAQLNTAMASTEDYSNTQLRLNLIQLASDVFDPSTYVFNDDGNPTLATPLIDLCAQLAENETVTGQWTFGAAVTFNSTITGGVSTVVTVTGQPRTRAFISAANQSIGNAAPTALSFDGESYDTASLHDTAVNPSRITIASGNVGIYSFVAQATFAADATGRRELAIYRNGSKVAEVKEFAPHATEEAVLQCNYQNDASLNDYYEAFVYQNSGGNLDVVKTVSWFGAIKAW